MSDVLIDCQGIVVLFTLDSEAAREFVRENVPLESWQWMGESAFAVDSRYAQDLVEGMKDVGLTVE